MQKFKKSKFIIFILIILILIIIAIISISNGTQKDLTVSMYKKILGSSKFTLTLEEEQSDYDFKVSIAQRETDISIDMNTEYSDENQHTTTLVTDGYAYYITHNEQEYITLNSDEIEADVLIPNMKDVDGKTYQKGKEQIKGKTYYYEEYEDISTFLMLIDVSDEGILKTRFYFDRDEIAYIKNIVEEDEEQTEELIKVNCIYDADDSLFEIPDDYAEI